MSLVLQTLERHARRQGQKTALCWRGGQLSYSGLWTEVQCIAHWLRQEAVKTLATYLDNGPAWVIVDLAGIAAEVTHIPLPLFFSPEQIQHTLETAKVDTLLLSLASPTVSLSGSSRAGLIEVAGVPCQALHRVIETEQALEVAKITFTSGTTGHPKGVCLSLKTMEAVAESLYEVTAGLGIRRHLCALPLPLLLENLAGIYAPLIAGASIVVPSLEELGMAGASGLAPSRFIDAINAYRPQSMILVPQLLRVLLEFKEAGARLPDSLRFIAVGGARIAPGLIQRARTLGLPVYEGYGLSECASVVTLNTPAQDRPGSAGRPLPHVQVRIRPDGEVEVAGAVMAGYLDGARLDDHFIATGDIGYLNTDGFLHITGRKKNVFITAYGRNVSPEWVESELLQEPSIRQAAVFGEARPWNIAVIVVRESMGLPDKAIIDAALIRINARLPDYARVKDWLPAKTPFSLENGELTANGRLRRDVIWHHYGDAIESLYQLPGVTHYGLL